jgi:hypothetical protein
LSINSSHLVVYSRCCVAIVNSFFAVPFPAETSRSVVTFDNCSLHLKYARRAHTQTPPNCSLIGNPSRSRLSPYKWTAFRSSPCIRADRHQARDSGTHLSASAILTMGRETWPTRHCQSPPIRFVPGNGGIPDGNARFVPHPAPDVGGPFAREPLLEARTVTV